MNDWVLWGRLHSDGTPIKLMGGSLAEVRKERVYRAAINHPHAFTDLRIRKQGTPYNLEEN